MRKTYSLPKLITFANDECLTTQVSVHSSDLSANADGKKVIKSGDLIVSATNGKNYIAKRRRPVSNTTVGTVGTLVLADVDNISVGDKIDFVFPGAIYTFADGTGSRTLNIGDAAITFAMGATGLTAVDNFVAAYNTNINQAVQGVEHSVVKVAPTKVLVQSKNKPVEALSWAATTNITTATFAGVVGDAYVNGVLGTVTAINSATKTITYTAETPFADLTLGTVGVRFKSPSVVETKVLGLCIQDYDLTDVDVKTVPLLTSSKGCYKSRLTYFDTDLVNQFPKIEFI